KPELWDYQIDTLKMWAKYVDGFRCDVAPLVPVEFWKRARKEVAEVRPGAVWLAESVDPGFIRMSRAHGMECASDAELYQAFDICYDYDVYEKFFDVLTGEGSLQDYADALNRQEVIYPGNYVKLRCLENHDRVRAAYLIRDEKALRSWTAFCAFQKGIFLLYAGEEKAVRHKPTLFDRDTVDWDAPENVDLSDLISRLTRIRRDPIFADSSYEVSVKGKNTIVAVHTANSSDPSEETGSRMVGIFNLSGEPSVLSVRNEIPDGRYENLLDGSAVEVDDMGRLAIDSAPVIFRVEK
ncbi:MAG: alpha-amylase family glycosyl hydrolase, partial [Bilifractor sp.]